MNANNDLFLLIDAFCETFSNPDLDPQRAADGSVSATFCNQAVSQIANRVAGYTKFNGLLANDIIQLMRESAEWKAVELEGAQSYANEGYLVIAGASSNPHGHVVVIRPGNAEWSLKWGLNTPKVCQIGAANFLDRSLAWVFKEKPEVWVYQGEAS